MGFALLLLIYVVVIGVLLIRASMQKDEARKDCDYYRAWCDKYTAQIDALQTSNIEVGKDRDHYVSLFNQSQQHLRTANDAVEELKKQLAEAAEERQASINTKSKLQAELEDTKKLLEEEKQKYSAAVATSKPRARR